MRNRLAGLLSLSLLLSLPASALSPVQSASQQQEKPKKKAGKVWTNDDFPSRPQSKRVEEAEKQEAEKQEAEKKDEPAAPSSAEATGPWAELEEGRGERESVERYLVQLRQQIEEWTEQRRRVSNPEVRDTLSLSIRGNEEEIVRQEERLKELDARIAALEKQTKGRPRPAPEKQPPAHETALPPSPPPSR